MARTVVIEGRSTEDALEEAARRLGRTPREGEYRLVENRPGFWGMSRKVVLELDLDEEASPDPLERELAPKEVPAEPRADRPAPEPPARAAGEGDTELAFVRKSAEEIALGVGLELSAEAHREEDRIRVDLAGPDSPRLTANRGELIGAIQYLLSKLTARKSGAPVRIDVDAGGFRERRHQELVALAKKTADAVRKGRKKALLPPMAPAERREIHLALADDPDVATESEGEGFRKRVAIFPRNRSVES